MSRVVGLSPRSLRGALATSPRSLRCACTWPEKALLPGRPLCRAGPWFKRLVTCTKPSTAGARDRAQRLLVGSVPGSRGLGQKAPLPGWLSMLLGYPQPRPVRLQVGSASLYQAGPVGKTGQGRLIGMEAQSRGPRMGLGALSGVFVCRRCPSERVQ